VATSSPLTLAQDKDMDDLEQKMKSAMTRVARRRSTYGSAFSLLFACLAARRSPPSASHDVHGSHAVSMLAEVNQQQLMLQGAASPSGDVPVVQVRILCPHLPLLLIIVSLLPCRVSDLNSVSRHDHEP
jgi:hypothetical protein